MATKDGLAQIWYADANGVIIGNTPNADNVANAIIDGYNEHFGTDINIWTPETINLQVGDPLPNWNAYEKIELPKTYIAVSVGGGNSPCAFGVVGQNNEVIFQSKDENTPWVASREGVIVGVDTGWPGVFTYVWKPKIDAALGIDSTASIEISSLEQGDEVPNWDSYQIIV